MKLRQLLTLLITISATLALLAACGTGPSSAETSEVEPLYIEFTNWWGDFTIIIAQEQGLFEKYGVQVEPVYYETFARAIPDLASGQIDGGLLAIGDAINVSRHIEVKAVAVYDNGGFNTVVSIPEIALIEDLKNRRVGVQVGTTYELLISEMLKTANLSMSDVTLVNINPEDVPLSLGQTIDAGFIYEPYTTEALAQGNNLLLKSADLIGLYPDVIVFRQEIIEARPDEIRAFLRAWFEAVEFRQQNPQEARQIIANYFNTTVNEITPDNVLEILSVEDNYILFNAENGIRRPIQQTAQLNAEYLVRIGVLSSSPDLDTLLDPRYLP